MTNDEIEGTEGPFLSIIVPVLNEAALIENFLGHVRSITPDAEIIVVDGGSTDGTELIADRMADVVIVAKRGRASQMNAGAALARGEVLWFIHADLRLPKNASLEMGRVLADSRVAGGCFRLRFPPRPLVYRVSDSLGNLGVETFGFALGDHGIFCRRAAFERVVGYRDVPLLEDAELYRALHQRGRMVQLGSEIRCSPRAYEIHGPHRTTAIHFLILALYVLGLPISALHRIYQRFRRMDSFRVLDASNARRQHSRPHRSKNCSNETGSPIPERDGSGECGLSQRAPYPAAP
jgi:rSAM/selenodomain-associated transferase 2